MGNIAYTEWKGKPYKSFNKTGAIADFRIWGRNAMLPSGGMVIDDSRHTENAL